MRRSRKMQLEYPPELGSGPRMGGRFEFPYTGTMAIWKGRPPILSVGDDLEPGALAISCTGGTTPGSSVTIDFSGANAWGGNTKRSFQIGGGMSALLQAGAFQHINCRAITPLMTGQTLYFSWINDPINQSDLYFYQAVQNGVPIDVPEGCTHIIPESACNIIFQIGQFGTTFTKAALAGEEIPALWGGFQTNATINVIFRLRGI